MLRLKNSTFLEQY